MGSMGHLQVKSHFDAPKIGLEDYSADCEANYVLDRFNTIHHVYVGLEKIFKCNKTRHYRVFWAVYSFF